METYPFFEPVWRAGTSAPNYRLDTAAIIHRLANWRSLCDFTITAAGPDTVDISFHTLPADKMAFVTEIYNFCPDVVDQDTAYIADMIDPEDPDSMPEEMKELVEGIDFNDENYGLEILKRTLERNKRLTLWWD